MKRLLTFAILLMTSTSLFAQDAPVTEEKDVTKFLGIRVDGTKSEMIEKLKEKGFVSNADYPDGVLTGVFNGKNVNIHVITNNNNKVYRIGVSDTSLQDESDIRIRFNNLYYQFKKNPRYITVDDYTIPENEDISYQMTVKNKRYISIHFQGGTHKLVWFFIEKLGDMYFIIICYDNEHNKANQANQYNQANGEYL